MPMSNPKAEHVDFSEFEGLIPENDKWSASNIDMCFHRYNKYTAVDSFLFIEWKHPDERDMLSGQKILLKALSKQPTTTVLLVIGWSKPNDVQVDTIYKVNTETLTRLSIPENQSGLDKLKSVIRVWYDSVSR